MEENKNIDLTKLKSYDDVKNIIYKVLQCELRKPTLREQIGYDLSNLIFNTEYSFLQEKHKLKFNEYIEKILFDINNFNVITSEALASEEEMLVFRLKLKELKENFDRESKKPNWTVNEDTVEVINQESESKGRRYMVGSIYFSKELSEWVVGVYDIGGVRQMNKRIFQAKHLIKV